MITPQMVLEFVENCAESRRGAIVANHNFHSLSLGRQCPELEAFFQSADLIQADSAPLIAWGKCLGLPIGLQHRSTYLDWREDFWSLANRHRWRVYYLGGAPGVAEAACVHLSEIWPRISFACHHGYFAEKSEEANAKILADIKAHDPHILLVGMGMPRQEIWIFQNRSELGRAVVFSVGAAFDYEAGTQRPAPRWMGRMGVEWLFRLVSQPRRLAYRYLIEPWKLLPVAVQDLRSRRHSPAPITDPAEATMPLQFLP